MVYYKKRRRRKNNDILDLKIAAGDFFLEGGGYFMDWKITTDDFLKGCLANAPDPPSL